MWTWFDKQEMGQLWIPTRLNRRTFLDERRKRDRIGWEWDIGNCEDRGRCASQQQHPNAKGRPRTTQSKVRKYWRNMVRPSVHASVSLSFWVHGCVRRHTLSYIIIPNTVALFREQKMSFYMRILCTHVYICLCVCVCACVCVCVSVCLSVLCLCVHWTFRWTGKIWRLIGGGRSIVLTMPRRSKIQFNSQGFG